MRNFDFTDEIFVNCILMRRTRSWSPKTVVINKKKLNKCVAANRATPVNWTSAPELLSLLTKSFAERP